MKYWTYTEIKMKVEQDLDLEEETFIQDDELLGYVNEAIDEAEAEIHTLYEDYFLTRQALSITSGTELYSMPTNIYGNKLRKVMYRNGAQVYEIKRLRDWKKIQIYTEELVNGTGNLYDYLILNSTPGEPEIMLTPTPRETGSFLTLWYLRNANRLLNDGLPTDICDIPEFVEFVIQYAKVRCYEKEGHPNLAKAMADLEQQRAQMTGTLAQMTADGDTEIEPDFSSYGDQV